MSTGFSPAQQQHNLRVSGSGIQSIEIRSRDVAHLPRTSVEVSESHSGEKEIYEGVLLCDLLAKACLKLGEGLRGPELAKYVVAEASDGYAALYSIAEIDPSISNNRILLADTMNGNLLDTKQGPFRIVVPNDKRPARWVRMVKAARRERSQSFVGRLYDCGHRVAFLEP